MEKNLMIKRWCGPFSRRKVKRTISNDKLNTINIKSTSFYK